MQLHKPEMKMLLCPNVKNEEREQLHRIELKAERSWFMFQTIWLIYFLFVRFHVTFGPQPHEGRFLDCLLFICPR